MTLAMWLLSSPARVPAQYTRTPLRNITGSVTDASHEPIRGAVVQMETAGTLAIKSYVTDEKGTYQFRNVPPDSDYTLWAMFRGNRSKTYNISKFDKQADRVIPITIVLEK